VATERPFPDFATALGVERSALAILPLLTTITGDTGEQQRGGAAPRAITRHPQTCDDWEDNVAKDKEQDELRQSLIFEDFEKDFGVREKRAEEVDTGKIFGLTAGERMILSMILFLAVSVLSSALLLATGTVALP
jgi:hypothetical protein